MPRHVGVDWERIRAEYEVGSTMGELSRKYGIAKSGISARAKREGWVQDTTDAVARLAEAKVNGVVNTVNPQKKAEAMDAAADQVVEVLLRHRKDWDRHQKLVDDAFDAPGFGDECKKAKIMAEMLKIRQEGERRAWGISDVLETHASVDATQTITIDGKNMDRESIEYLVDQAYRLEASKE